MRKRDVTKLMAAGEKALEPPGGRRRSPRNCLYRLTGPNSGSFTGSKVEAFVRPCAEWKVEAADNAAIPGRSPASKEWSPMR